MSDPILGTDASGEPAPSYTLSDTNGDGLVDAYSADLDGDGFVEYAAYDLDGDGSVDADIVVDRATGASTTTADTDGDGLVDAMLIDADGDGYVDEAYIDPSTSIPSADTPPTDPVVAPGLDSADTSSPELFIDSDDLPDAGDEGMHGDPRADIVYHTVQPGPVDCLPTSVSMIISEVTGTDVSAEELVALANEKGFMTPSGMGLEGSLSLLEQYGVEAEIEYGDADYLRDALDAGDEVILAIDSADLYADGGGPFDPGMTSGHAVVLTGVDDGPPAYVYINDPAFADGAGVQVPLEEFLDAWEDSDNAVVSIPVDATAAEQAAGSASVDTTQSASASSDAAGSEKDVDSVSVHRILLLPITLLHTVAAWVADSTRTS